MAAPVQKRKKTKKKKNKEATRRLRKRGMVGNRHRKTYLDLR